MQVFNLHWHSCRFDARVYAHAHLQKFDKALRTEQRHIEDNKLNSQKVAENNNSKKQNQRQTRSNITQIFSIFFVENHSTTLHYTMHMAWVGLHDFIYIEFLVSSQGPLPKEDPVGACGDGVSRGMHWARGAETFAHWPR